MQKWNSTDEEGVPNRASHHDRLKQNKFMNRFKVEHKVERFKQDKRGGEEPAEASVNKNVITEISPHVFVGTQLREIAKCTELYLY